MFGLGIGEGLILLAIILLLFGGKKLPELAKSMGKSLNSFKEGMKEGNEESKDKKIEEKED